MWQRHELDSVQAGFEPRRTGFDREGQTSTAPCSDGISVSGSRTTLYYTLSNYCSNSNSNDCLQVVYFLLQRIRCTRLINLLAIFARSKHVLLIYYRTFSYFCPFKFSYFCPFKYFFGHVYMCLQQVCVFLQQVCVFLLYLPGQFV
jgi:hypothetical protein